MFHGVERALEKVVAGAAVALCEIGLMPKFDNQTIQLFIIAVAALAVVLQAIVLIAILLSVKKVANSIQAEIQDLRSAVAPLIFSSRDFFTRVAPKIEEFSTDVADIVHTLHTRTTEFDSTATVILERLQVQTVRVDGMFTGALDSIDRVGGYVSEAVSKPVRQLSALMAAAKAVVESLRASASQPHSTAGSGDEDKFV
jgi:hypothetical protein